MPEALSPGILAHPLDAVRSACARVSARARSVRIDPDRLRRFAATIPLEEVRTPAVPSLPRGDDSRETRAAFVLTLNAVNFGSGYFPGLAKRRGLSGYRSIEAALRERFETHGPLAASHLQQLGTEDCAALFGQTLESPEMRELMTLYAEALRDLGMLVADRFGGSFGALVTDAGGSAESLVRTLLEMPLYRDVARYQELQVPFLKRAQLAVADLARALPGRAGRFRDLARLTMFADNLVAHVLRLQGVLWYDPDLAAPIEREELIPAGSVEEVEIRACEVHAVEMLVAALGTRVAAHQIDLWLWTRGGTAEARARTRHRTRCTYY